MAEGNDLVMAEVMSLLEAEPDSKSNSLTDSLSLPGPDIPAFREELAILVSTGKAKEAIGVQLTQEHVKCLEAKDVEITTKRTRLMWAPRPLTPLLISFSRCTPGRLGRLCRLKTLKLCRMISKKIRSSPKSRPPLSEVLR